MEVSTIGLGVAFANGAGIVAQVSSTLEDGTSTCRNRHRLSVQFFPHLQIPRTTVFFVSLFFGIVELSFLLLAVSGSPFCLPVFAFGILDSTLTGVFTIVDDDVVVAFGVSS